MDMKKLLLNILIIFGSAQLFIQSVKLFTEGNRMPVHQSPSASNINSDLPVKLKRSAGTVDNIIKSEAGVKNKAIPRDFYFTVLPYNIAKINGLLPFYDPGVNLNDLGLISANN
jgi:hypothetical protein